MKIERLEFAIPYVGSVKLEGLECTNDEFYALLKTVKELQQMEVEKARAYRTHLVIPEKPTTPETPTESKEEVKY